MGSPIQQIVENQKNRISDLKLCLSHLTCCVCVCVCTWLPAAGLCLYALACLKETQVGRSPSPSGRGGSVSSWCPLKNACTLWNGYSAHRIYTTGVSLITGTLCIPFSHDAPATYSFYQLMLSLEILCTSSYSTIHIWYIFDAIRNLFFFFFKGF